MEKFIVEIVNLPLKNESVSMYLENYLNWAEGQGFELMFVNSIQAQALCFFKKYKDVVNELRPSQKEFDENRE